MIRTLLVLGLFSSLLPLSAQTTFSHMHYNLTLFGNPFSCDESNNNTTDKEGWLRDIVAFAQPDVLCVNELDDSDFYADRILKNCLNIGENPVWSRAELTDFATTSSIINGFYYRSDKFRLHDQRYVNRAVDNSFLLRPTDFYVLHSIPVVGDTVFITFGVVHLAASDEDERADQTEASMVEIAEQGYTNVIFSGDMNIDSSSEEAFQFLINPNDESIALFDPVDALGTWHNNGSFSDLHTQSTRFNDTNSGCFAPGGLDDRFDMTLVGADILSGENGVTYIADSYKALGQDGTDYNSALGINSNTAVPSEIANALYEMSDHLPVVSDYIINTSVGVSENRVSPFRLVNPMRERLLVYGPAAMNTVGYVLHDLSGRVHSFGRLNLGQSMDIGILPSGTYILRLEDESGGVSTERLVVL